MEEVVEYFETPWFNADTGEVWVEVPQVFLDAFEEGGDGE